MDLSSHREYIYHLTRSAFSLCSLDISCFHFLVGDANLQISSLAEELAKKTEDASRQQEEITHLLSQIVDLQKKAKSVSAHLLGTCMLLSLQLQGHS